MATANHLQARAEKQYYAGFSGDLDLLLDLDLNSLASPWDEFVEALARIRTEFSWASEVVFCSIQLQILENFANADVRLYRRAEISEKSAASLNYEKELPNFLPVRGNAKAWLEFEFDEIIRRCSNAQKGPHGVRRYFRP